MKAHSWISSHKVNFNSDYNACKACQLRIFGECPLGSEVLYALQAMRGTIDKTGDLILDPILNIISTLKSLAGEDADADSWRWLLPVKRIPKFEQTLSTRKLSTFASTKCGPLSQREHYTVLSVILHHAIATASYGQAIANTQVRRTSTSMIKRVLYYIG